MVDSTNNYKDCTLRNKKQLSNNLKLACPYKTLFLNGSIAVNYFFSQLFNKL